MRVPVLLPEDLWKSLWTSGKFENFVVKSTQVLERFWDEVGNHPALLHHPVKAMQGYKRRAVPLCIHGDGASVTQSIGSASKSCLFVSFRSLTALTPKHFVMCAVWSHVAAKAPSMNTSKSVFSILSNSFLRMQQAAGQDTGGFFGVPVFLEGDLEYYNEWLRLPRWNSANPCSLCSLHKKDIKNWNSVGDVLPDPWLVPRNTPCPLFRKLISPAGVCVDWMHSKHLGIDQRFLGSVTWLFIFVLSNQATTLDSRLFQLVHELKDTWKHQGMPCLVNSFFYHTLYCWKVCTR